MNALVTPVESATMTVEIVWVEGSALHQRRLQVPVGIRIAAFLETAVGSAGLPADILSERGVAVFGRLRGPEQRLWDGDRIELLGPLQVDPKVARERRVAHRRAALPRSRWRPQGR